MAEITPQLVKQLRDMTGAGMMDCKTALNETAGDVEKAVTWLREKGIAKAAKRQGRATENGLVEAYLHRTGDLPPMGGAMIELTCETDFVAKSEEFRALARHVAMHVYASNPRWVAREDVPEELVQAESELYRRKAESEGKPAAALDKIVQGQVEGFYKENCLYDQAWVRDGKTTIGDLLKEHISKLQENITVRRMSRFHIKEG